VSVDGDQTQVGEEASAGTVGPEGESIPGASELESPGAPVDGLPVDDPALSSEISAMAQAIERFHHRAEQYESVIRRMQSRIEELQGDQVRELLKPVILKLAALHTEARKSEQAATDRGDAATQKDFDFFVTDIEETLGLLDIESIGAAGLDVFDPAKHAARRRVDTTDVSLDRRLERVLRQGFTYVGAERVFMPAMVTVYRHQADVVAPNESANNQNEGES
jgi:molecular chaperone GrpE (heat shock protein)